MSLKFKHDEIDKKEAEKTVDENLSIKRYEGPAKVRNLYLKDVKGHQYVFNYADMRMIDYSPETKKLRLTFISHELVLEGNNMEHLVSDFSLCLPKSIQSVDKRYSQLAEKETILVYSITILSKD